VTHNFKSISILAVCCIVMAMIPAAADTLNNYLGASSVSGQAVSYAAGNNTFTDGNLVFQFTSLTITPTCVDSVSLSTVACGLGSYNPITANGLQIAGTTGLNGSNGFDLSGEADVNSYFDNTSQHQIEVNEDINLNYTVSTVDGSASITDAHLSVGGCAVDPGAPAQNQGQGGCLSNGIGLPPSLKINENFLGTGTTMHVSTPPPVINAMTAFLTPYSSLQVTKDIFMDSGACTGCSVSFSDVKQFYSQVPEPRTYAWVLALGMLGLTQLRRRLTAKV
jgi:hypothetical protein